MKTYVAVLNGEPILAFRAETDEDAQEIAQDDEGGLQAALLDAVREDGTELWDGDTVIETRSASEAEHQRWQQDAKEGGAVNGDGDPDDIITYLVSVAEAADEDPDAA